MGSAVSLADGSSSSDNPELPPVALDNVTAASTHKHVNLKFTGLFFLTGWSRRELADQLGLFQDRFAMGTFHYSLCQIGSGSVPLVLAALPGGNVSYIVNVGADCDVGPVSVLSIEF